MSTKNEDYEHWPNDGKLQAVEPTPAPRYDSRNGMREHIYRPAGEVKEALPEPPKQDPAPPAQQYVQYAQYGQYPQMPYSGGPMPYMPYAPAPAYYGYGGAPLAPPAYGAYTTAAAPVEAKKDEPKPKPAKASSPPQKWQGRTRAEVEEDDMKLAASQGAYAPRQVQPLGLADDQVVWVVDVDEKPTLRTFAEVKESKGEWKADPRFKDSWYFVRTAEDEKKD